MSSLSLVTLGVADLDRSVAFYTALGWRRSSASVEGTVAFMRGGTVVLSLYGREDLARDAGVPMPVTGHAAPISLAMNVASVAGVDAALATAAGAGGRVVRAGHRTAWGGYIGYALDPDGHVWEFAHNPGFGLLDDGRVVLPDDQQA
jgi:catechol 2,3-dioxygenase-like lactoylglutathione lyase family enzyme